jgi:hypothetical protein
MGTKPPAGKVLRRYKKKKTAEASGEDLKKTSQGGVI